MGDTLQTSYQRQVSCLLWFSISPSQGSTACHLTAASKNSSDCSSRKSRKWILHKLRSQSAFDSLHSGGALKLASAWHVWKPEPCLMWIYSTWAIVCLLPRQTSLWRVRGKAAWSALSTGYLLTRRHPWGRWHRETRMLLGHDLNQRILSCGFAQTWMIVRELHERSRARDSYQSYDQPWRKADLPIHFFFP